MHSGRYVKLYIAAKTYLSLAELNYPRADGG